MEKEWCIDHLLRRFGINVLSRQPPLILLRTVSPIRTGDFPLLVTRAPALDGDFKVYLQCGTRQLPREVGKNCTGMDGYDGWWRGKCSEWYLQ